MDPLTVFLIGTGLKALLFLFEEIEKEDEKKRAEVEQAQREREERERKEQETRTRQRGFWASLAANAMISLATGLAVMAIGYFAFGIS